MYRLIIKSERLSEVVGKQKIDLEKRYNGSIFNHIVKVDEGILVFNTFMNVFVYTDIENLTYFRRNEEFSITDHNDDIKFFIENRLIVPKDFNETNLYTEFHELMRTIEDAKQGIERYNILTTTYCNAQCFYCFEEGIEQQTMSLETANSVIAYIERTHTKSKPIYLRWFGGEPLVNSTVIDKICIELTKKNISFYSTISSNGYLIDDKIINSASTLWNVNKIRISMDGIGCEHNVRKNYQNKGDAYKKTIDNIERVVESGITMSVKLNMDNENTESIHKLAQYFTEKYKTTENFNIYVSCLFSEISTEKVKSDKEAVNRLLNKKKEIDDYLQRNKIYDFEKLAPVGYRTYFCAANNPNMETIVPNGNLCSCECHCFDYAHWGNVRDGIINKKEYHLWLKNKIQKKCVDCVFLPQCTPFVFQCPMATCDCKTKFSSILDSYMKENYMRYKSKLPLIEEKIYSGYNY